MLNVIVWQTEHDKKAQRVKVKIVKAPLVDSQILKNIIWQRQRAIVL